MVHKSLEKLPSQDDEVIKPPEEFVVEEPVGAIVLQTPEDLAKRAEKEQMEMRSAREEISRAFENKEGPRFESNDHYEALGVSPEASMAEVKKAYRALAIEYHPDKYRNAPVAEQNRVNKIMVRINAAYEILGDQDKRARYDNIRKSLSLESDHNSATALGEKHELLEAMGGAEDNLSTMIEIFGGDKNALTRFTCDVVTLSNGMEELSGNLKKDADPIKTLFSDYGISADRDAIERAGASFYEGAVKQRKKDGRKLLKVFFNLLRDLDRAVDQEIPKAF